MDGHERADVVQKRNEVVDILLEESANSVRYQWTENKSEWKMIPRPESEEEPPPRESVFLYHDESIFKSKATHSFEWYHPDVGSKLLPKDEGHGIMVAGF